MDYTPLQTEQEGGGQETECALNGNATVHKYHPKKNEKYDLLLTLEGKKKSIVNKLEKELKKHRGIKWFLCTKVKIVKSSPEGQEQTLSPHFRSMCNKTTNAHDIEKAFEESVEKIKSSFLEYQREGSGWQLDEVSNQNDNNHENNTTAHYALSLFTRSSNLIWE